MHRIDSATARADANGAGKTGFSDNGDLPNQDATYFTPAWANSIQEEIANVIEEFGIALDKNNNGQLLAALVQQFAEKQVLTDAVAEYKDLIKTERERIDELENRTYEDTQIGEHIWVDQHFLTPEAVATYKGYGTWERALQGRVAVGFSDNPSDDVRFRTSNAEYGESEVALTVSEMPSHKHGYIAAHEGGSGTRYPDDTGHISINGSGATYIQHEPDEADGSVMTLTGGNSMLSSGGGLAHNNIQQSKTLDCWKRVT